MTSRPTFFCSLLYVVALVIVHTDGRSIVGGELAREDRYPWISALFQAPNDPNPFCAGTLIAQNVVLSAARCFDPTAVKVGCYHIDDVCEKVGVKQVVIHPNYSIHTAFGSDISIVELTWDIVSVPAIPFIAGKNLRAIPTNTMLTVLGWGRTYNGGEIPVKLREVEVPVVDQVECLRAYEGEDNLIDGTLMCAGSTGIGSCDGDEGGPILIKCEGNQNDILVGVLSFPMCGEYDAPDVYAKTSSGIDFITSTLMNMNITLREAPALDSVCQGDPVANPVPSPRPATEPVPYPTAVDGWTCPGSHYASLDGCDCGCGAPDLDCEDPKQPIFGCDGEELCIQGICMNSDKVPEVEPGVESTPVTGVVSVGVYIGTSVALIVVIIIVAGVGFMNKTHANITKKAMIEKEIPQEPAVSTKVYLA